MHSSYWYLLTNFCTSSSLSGDHIDVNSNESSTIYDSPKTMKLEGGILCVWGGGGGVGGGIFFLIRYIQTTTLGAKFCFGI